MRTFPWPLILTFLGVSSLKIDFMGEGYLWLSWLTNLALKGDWLLVPSNFYKGIYEDTICLSLPDFWFEGLCWLAYWSGFMVLFTGWTLVGLINPALYCLCISKLIAYRNLKGVNLSLRSLLKQPASIFLIY